MGHLGGTIPQLAENWSPGKRVGLEQRPEREPRTRSKGEECRTGGREDKIRKKENKDAMKQVKRTTRILIPL